MNFDSSFQSQKNCKPAGLKRKLGNYSLPLTGLTPTQKRVKIQSSVTTSVTTRLLPFQREVRKVISQHQAIVTADAKDLELEAELLAGMSLDQVDAYLLELEPLIRCRLERYSALLDRLKAVQEM